MNTGARFTLREGEWYAWQWLKGGPSAPLAATPVFITLVEPTKRGLNRLRLQYVRLVAPLRAVQERRELLVRYREPDFLLSTLTDRGHAETVVITPLTFDWLNQVQSTITRRFNTSWMFNDDEAQVADYMTLYFGKPAQEILAASNRKTYVGELPRAWRFKRVPYIRRFEGIDAWLLLRGLKPNSSDDKWFIHVDWHDQSTGDIYFRRSWGAGLRFKVPFASEDAAIRTECALVSMKDKEQMADGCRDSVSELDSLIRELLIGAQ